MKRKLLTLGVLGLVFALQGCKKEEEEKVPSTEKLCAKGCEQSIRCGDETDADACQTDCETELAESSRDCRKALDEFLACSDDGTCGESADDEESETRCLSEAVAVFVDCPELIELGTDPDACCGPADECDWANDGICDCDGDYEWDAADCE